MWNVRLGVSRAAVGRFYNFGPQLIVAAKGNSEIPMWLKLTWVLWLPGLRFIFVTPSPLSVPGPDTSQCLCMYLWLCAPCGVAAYAHCLSCHRGTCLFPMLAVLLHQPTTVGVCALEKSSCRVVGMKNPEQTLSEFLQVGKLISIWTVITRAFFSFPFPLGGIFDLYFWMGQGIALCCPLRACAIQFLYRWWVIELFQFLGL